MQFWIKISNPEVLVSQDVLSLGYLLEDFYRESSASLLSLVGTALNLLILVAPVLSHPRI